MAVKSKAKPSSKTKSKSVVKTKVSKNKTSKPIVRKESPKRPITKQGSKSKKTLKLAAKSDVVINSVVETTKLPKTPVKPVVTAKRVVSPTLERRRPIKRTPRVNHFAFMKAPGIEHAFDVGDTVEVFCDHEKNRERIRGWVKGIVVQIDNKLVAVQFRSNVYLTDGWMVPDRILWFPVISEHIRPVPGKKVVRKDFIPDY